MWMKSVYFFLHAYVTYIGSGQGSLKKYCIYFSWATFLEQFQSDWWNLNCKQWQSGVRNFNFFCKVLSWYVLIEIFALLFLRLLWLGQLSTIFSTSFLEEWVREAACLYISCIITTLPIWIVYVFNLYFPNQMVPI